MKRLSVIVTLLLTACGSGGIYTATDKAPTVETSMNDGGQNITVTKDAFLFASPYPARILIPDLPGMRSTAFVVSSGSPAGMIAIDLDAQPYALSQQFKSMVSPTGSGLPNNLVIQSSTRAFLLTSSHIIDFNPTSGSVHATLQINTPITLPQPAALSRPFDYNNNGSDDITITTITPQSPGGIALVGNRLFVTCSNYLRYAPPVVAAPGLVLAFNVLPNAPYLAKSAPHFIVTSGFNPTGVRALNDQQLLVTNSGAISITGGEAVPQTEASVDIIDAAAVKIIQTVPADLAALSFFPATINATTQTAYFGSVAFSEIYQLDLSTAQWQHNLLNPIRVGPATTADYITAAALAQNGKALYVSSFDQSAVIPVDISSSTPKVQTAISIGFAKGVTPQNPSGVNTGAGDIAVRPGVPGTDFTGPDLFLLTGNPGSLVTIQTYNAGTAAVVAAPTTIIISPPLLTMQNGESAQTKATIDFGNGQQLSQVTSNFVHPLTQQTLSLSWQSDNPAIATVSNDGVVTAVSSGVTLIRAQFGGTTGKTTVAVHFGPLNPTPIPQPTPSDSGKLIVVNCKDIGTSPFISQVVSYTIGTYGGANENKLPNIVMGPPHGEGSSMGSIDTYSLGGKGSIIVAFNNCWIADGPGADFTVFENAFYLSDTKTPFSEPAIVGVSMDGVTFTDFPCALANAPMYPGCAGVHPVYSNPKNGIDPLDPSVSGGDIFDLADIKIPSARFIRIVDQGLSSVIGNGTNGFDLDAIAVLHGAKP